MALGSGWFIEDKSHSLERMFFGKGFEKSVPIGDVCVACFMEGISNFFGKHFVQKLTSSI